MFFRFASDNNGWHKIIPTHGFYGGTGLADGAKITTLAMLGIGILRAVI